MREEMVEAESKGNGRSNGINYEIPDSRYPPMFPRYLK